MGNVFWFLLEGESIDGEFLQFEWGIENAENFDDALNLVTNEAIKILNKVDGGHLDIFNNDTHEFIIDVEV